MAVAYSAKVISFQFEIVVEQFIVWLRLFFKFSNSGNVSVSIVESRGRRR